MSHCKIVLGGNHAGLGGRLKTIAWGKTLAAVAKLDYQFIWPLADACGGITLNPAKQLITNIDFYLPATPWITHDDWMQGTTAHKQTSRIESMQSYATEFINHHSASEVVFDFSYENQKPLKAFVEKYGIMLQYKGAGVVLPQKYIGALQEKYVSELRNLRPSNEVTDKINNVTDKCDITSCIGVHVRRGDIEELNSKFQGLARRYIHEEQYFEILDKTESATFTNILLCTESEDVIESFKTRYGTRVIHQPIAVDQRGSIEGVQDAYAEILLLSKCKYIIGGPSNFSELAALIGGINIQRLNR